MSTIPFSPQMLLDPLTSSSSLFFVASEILDYINKPLAACNNFCIFQYASLLRSGNCELMGLDHFYQLLIMYLLIQSMLAPRGAIPSVPLTLSLFPCISTTLLIPINVTLNRLLLIYTKQSFTVHG